MIDWTALADGRWAYLETDGGVKAPKRNPYPYPSIKNESWSRGWEIAQKQEREGKKGD